MQLEWQWQYHLQDYLYDRLSLICEIDQNDVSFLLMVQLLNHIAHQIVVSNDNVCLYVCLSVGLFVQMSEQHALQYKQDTYLNNGCFLFQAEVRCNNKLITGNF